MKVTRGVVTMALAAVGFAACSPTERAGEQTTVEAAGTLADDPAPMFREEMRELWSDHAIWTRAYIAAAADGHASVEAAAGRLMKNQEEIGEAIAPYYGNEAGNQLTALLKEHVTIVGNFVGAAKSDDKDARTRVDSVWQKNGDDIATLLSGANTTHWNKNDLVDLLKEHRSLTIAAAENRMEEKWDDDISGFDKIHDHAMKIADALSSGIVRQFPDKF